MPFRIEDLRNNNLTTKTNSLQVFTPCNVKLKNIQGHEIVVASLKGLRFSKGIDMYLASDVEPNSGLGASSSLTSNLVNVISAIQQKRNSKNEK